MHPIRIMYIQVPQVVMKLAFICSGKHLAFPVHILLSANSRGVGREVANEVLVSTACTFISFPLV